LRGPRFRARPFLVGFEDFQRGDLADPTAAALFAGGDELEGAGLGVEGLAVAGEGEVEGLVHEAGVEFGPGVDGAVAVGGFDEEVVGGGGGVEFVAEGEVDFGENVREFHAGKDGGFAVVEGFDLVLGEGGEGGGGEVGFSVVEAVDGEDLGGEEEEGEHGIQFNWLRRRPAPRSEEGWFRRRELNATIGATMRWHSLFCDPQRPEGPDSLAIVRHIS